MGLFSRRSKMQAESLGQPRSHDASQGHLIWLPGSVEVQLPGEFYHEDEIRTVYEHGSLGSPLVAVLVPDPGNAYDSNAVAVSVNGEDVGFLPREIARRVQATIATFSRAHGGRLVSCPAEIRWQDVGLQVVLLLDPVPLGLRPEAFEAPNMAATTIRLLARLDEPPPVLNGDESLTRMQFVKVEQERLEIDANYDRDPDDLPRVEHALRGLAERLTKGGDPSASVAWLSVARAVRYQRGRRDDTLSALIEALYWGRGNAAAWSELIDYISAVPRVPMLLAIFAHIPSENRVDTLSQLLLISEGHGRLTQLNAAAGERLRDGLLNMAEYEGDRAAIAALTGHAGRAAEKAGDLDAAVRYWRRAVAAGSTDPRVADRLSAWLVNGHEYQEATRVLQQALTANPSSATITERLERRLARCEDPHAPASRHPRIVAPASMPARRETLTCTECGQDFQRVITRGRKPSRCPGCAGSHAAVQERYEGNPAAAARSAR